MLVESAHSTWRTSILCVPTQTLPLNFRFVTLYLESKVSSSKRQRAVPSFTYNFVKQQLFNCHVLTCAPRAIQFLKHVGLKTFQAFHSERERGGESAARTPAVVARKISLWRWRTRTPRNGSQQDGQWRSKLEKTAEETRSENYTSFYLLINLFTSQTLLRKISRTARSLSNFPS